MSRNDLWKWLTLAVLAVLSVFVIVPPKEKIRLGIDLEGGTSFIVAIDQKKLESNIKGGDPDLTDLQVKNKIASILKDADARAIEVIRNRIDRLGVNEPVIQSGDDHRLTIQLPGISAADREAAEISVKSAAFLEFKLVHKKSDEWVDKMFASDRLPEGYVYSSGGRAFVRIAEDEYKKLVADPEYPKRLSLFQVSDPRYAFMLQQENTASGEIIYKPVYVLRKAEMTGEALKSASVEQDPMTGRVRVALDFKAAGAVAFATLTKNYAPHGPRNKKSEVGRRLAIVLDDTIYSAPAIRTEIPNGKAIIEGSFTYKEASVLRNILNAGSLPAPMEILEKRVVDSSLGEKSIMNGLVAAAVATVMVALFMLIYYSYCGLIANVALILDLLLLPAGLIVASNILGIFVRDSSVSGSAMDLPVLTMPGIAGIVLTLGMAVDANVLIFERIREEFTKKKSARAAVAAGYDRAFLAIFDSNITTLLTAAILFIFGVGPIRGFAITLSAGIMISMFTALVVTRLIFNITVPVERMKPYRMLSIIKGSNINFLGLGKKAGTVSIVIIVVTLVIFSGRVWKTPASVLGVDFTGGSAMTFHYDEKAKAGDDDIRRVLSVVDNGAVCQYQSTIDGSGNFLQVKTGALKIGEVNASTVIEKALVKEFPDSKFKLAGEEGVGPEIGEDLKKAARWAVIASLIGILAYVSLRFEFGFALGGVVALAHDAFITLGLFSLTGRQVSLPIVAALLTIMGYSINDTIVVFDRIREDLRKDPKTDFKTLCNSAINLTLSRTILTTLTTMIALIVLFVFGGGAINDFALAMLIGVAAGTYSTIFIATPVMLAWYRGRRPGFATVKKH